MNMSLAPSPGGKGFWEVITMKTYTVAILGATGAVGQEMIKILQERNFPVGKLIPLASARSAGNYIDFKGEKVMILEAKEENFEGLDFVLGAVEGEQSQIYAPMAVSKGAVYIDNSSAFRLDPNVPLVVPEINGADAFQNKGIIANPNCCTIIAHLLCTDYIYPIYPFI